MPANSVSLANQQMRRSILNGAGMALGGMAWQWLTSRQVAADPLADRAKLPFPPKAKRVIYLCQSGGPSQQDLFDDKPVLRQRSGEVLPESIRMGQRLTTMTASQDRLPLIGSRYAFRDSAVDGMRFSELLPHTSKIADKLCVIRSMHTDAINHDPAITLLLTGHALPGRPSMGSWIRYGLGRESDNLPAFVVLTSKGGSLEEQQPLFDRLWSSGFLPSETQGVRFRGGRSPILYLNSPSGIDRSARRSMIDTIAKLNRQQSEAVGDPEIEARTRQYELAFRMQMTVPSIADISDEPRSVLESYGPAVHTPGSFAANCLLARRLVERDVPFVQLFHRGWDQHEYLSRDLPRQCTDTDQPSAALVRDLQRLGLLEDTLVVWGGEFGRTSYGQGSPESERLGRDHHSRCFTMWLAGGGIKPGCVWGETDELGYNIVRDPVHVHDLNATILHQLGMDHRKLTYRFQSRDYRLTDIHGEVIQGILS